MLKQILMNEYFIIKIELYSVGSGEIEHVLG